MNNTDFVSQRLFNHRIDGEKFEKPEEVVKWMGAIQAQNYSQSLWGIGLRMQSGTITNIEQAIADRKIIRTWPMRGTIHFVPPEDAKWMLKLSVQRMLAKDKRRMEQLELDDKIMERCKELFYNALKGGNRLSRPNMMKLLEDADISTKNQRGYHILWYTSQTGLICQGPMQDKQQTFVLLDEWAPNSKELSREESLAELSRRYFASHGPATIHDFAWWAGLTVTDARLGLEVVKPELISEKINGKEHWMATNAQSHKADDKSSVHLLPGFDEYLLGYKDRGAVLDVEHAPKVVPGKNGVFLPTIVVGGQIVGTWERTIKKNSIDITLNPFIQPGDSEEGMIEAAKWYSDFIGLPLSSTTIKVST
ncbi:winged helix DNA-binding domain-containing protein [Pseudalkalibacillus decolorationis]|uniref:winged helix DNA-binding domain-containing protein n=1 Tax=Pseudalkalibacillus decolorationis TaxID=163879 RepID=UPI0021489573|nr:winged helix DNA-binding domain-containing protein [Pseudalkalibacillus decolorationis]